MRYTHKSLIIGISLFSTLAATGNVWADTNKPPITSKELDKIFSTATSSQETALFKQCMMPYHYSESDIKALMQENKWKEQANKINSDVTDTLTSCLSAAQLTTNTTKKSKITIQIQTINNYINTLTNSYEKWAVNNGEDFALDALMSLKNTAQLNPSVSSVAIQVQAPENIQMAAITKKHNNNDTLTEKDFKDAAKIKATTYEEQVKACKAPFDASPLGGLGDKTKEKIIESLSVQIDNCINALTTSKADNNSAAQIEIKTRLTEMKQELHDSILEEAPGSGDVNRTQLLFEIKNIDEFLQAKINKAIEFNEVEYEIPPWRSESFSYQFYAGIEATTLNEFMEETNVRAGFQGYKRFTRRLERLKDVIDTRGSCKPNEKCHDWGFDLHVFGNINLTTVGEHTFVENKSDSTTTDETTDTAPTTDTNDTNATTDEETKADVDQALVGEIGVFMPVYMSIDGEIKNKNYQEFMFGPIVTTGFNFTDKTQDSFNTRYYIGFRMAHNEESYLDVVYGKSEGIRGKRLEVRGQLPVSTLAGGRLFVGGRANVAIDKYKKETEDAWQIYLQWQTSFDALWDQSKKESK